MTSLYDYSTTPASNATVGSVNFAEGQNPSTVNDSMRQVMADLAAWLDTIGPVKISSGTDTVTLTSGLSLSAYAQGLILFFEAGGANTGAVTLNIDSVGAKAVVKRYNVALAAGDIVAGQIVGVAYEAGGDNFQLLTPTANAPGDAIGPASSTDDGLATYNGTGGKTLQSQTGWTLNDSNVLNGADNTLQRPKLLDYGETVNALGDLGGGTDDIDLTAGNVVSATVSTATQTFTFSNPPATGTAGSFTLFLTNGGSQTVNWPASVDWAGGTAPTLTSSGVDILTFTTIDGGTIWYGFAAGLDMQ